MRIVNILKKPERVRPTQVVGMVKKSCDYANFSKTVQSLKDGESYTYRMFEISKAGSSFVVSPKNTMFLKKFLVSKGINLSSSLQSELLSIVKNPVRVSVKHSIKLFEAAHRDLIYLISDSLDNKSDIISDYLRVEMPALVPFYSSYKPRSKVFARANLLEFNKFSSVLSKDTSINQHTDRFTKKTIIYFDKTDAIHTFEVQLGFDPEKVENLLGQVKQVLTYLGLSKVSDTSLQITFKIRKMKRTNKRGLFIKHLNMLLVDPRTVDSVWHELGHWIYENKLSLPSKRCLKPLSLDCGDSEAYAELFSEIIFKNVLKE